jgi:hypothetical protein
VAAEPQDLNVPVITTVGIVASLLVATIIIGTQAWYYNEFTREDDFKWTKAPVTDLAIKRTEQKDLVAHGGALDPDTGNKDTIPIAEAMKKSIESETSK